VVSSLRAWLRGSWRYELLGRGTIIRLKVLVRSWLRSSCILLHIGVRNFAGVCLHGAAQFLRKNLQAGKIDLFFVRGLFVEPTLFRFRAIFKIHHTGSPVVGESPATFRLVSDSASFSN